MTVNRFLEGNFGPVHDEVTAFDLQVTGELPPELNGRYLRNGPNPMLADPETYHWFTGDAMVHGVRLAEGRAEWFRNRWVRTGSVPEALGEEDPGGPRTPGADFPVNTNVIGTPAGRCYALVEAGAKPVELDDELNTIARSDLGGTLPNGASAHLKLDPSTSELHMANYFWERPSLIEYVVVGADGRVRRTEDIEVPGSPMVHDISITERHAVVYDLPVTFDADEAMSGSSFPYRWNDDYGARVGVLPIGGSASEVRWFEVAPCYVFHALNAHDHVSAAGTEQVVLDVVRHERVFDTSRLGPDESVPALWRWTLDLTTGAVTEEQLGDEPIEFPRVDERVVGRRQRYGWGLQLQTSDLAPGVAAQIAATGTGTTFDGSNIVCRDFDTGAVRSHRFGPGRSAGEAVFVPRFDGAAEDDGYLLTYVHDAETDRSDLVVLAAQDIEADPVAVVHLPQRVPAGFHGNWLPDPA